MNKEQFIATLQACYFGDKGAYNLILKEYEKKHNKIDKAIEYIEDYGHGYDWTGDGYYCLDEDNQKELLEILKGDVNE